MSDEIKYDRRRFLSTAAMSIAAAQVAMASFADAQSNKIKSANSPKMKRGMNMLFGSLKQIDAGVLNVGYAEAGPAAGPAVILLHGWPYDIHSFIDVAPLLPSAGYRVIVPFVRGYGTMRFLSSGTFRNGQPSALALAIRSRSWMPSKPKTSARLRPQVLLYSACCGSDYRCLPGG